MAMRWMMAWTVMGACFAQGPAPEGGALKAYLNLSDAQVEQMRKAGEQARKQADERVKTLQPQLEQKRAAVRDLMAKGSTDATAVGKAMLEVQAVEKQIREAHESARKSSLAVLTPEQRTKFRAIEDAALLPQATREAMRMGLAGAPGGPGPRMGQGPWQGRGPGMMQRRMMGQGQRIPGQGMMRQRGGPGPNMGQGPNQEQGPEPGQGPRPNMGPGRMMRRGPNGPPPNDGAPRPPQPPQAQQF